MCCTVDCVQINVYAFRNILAIEPHGIAATMSGVHRGVQRKIIDINPKAAFIPCNNHSLNLAGFHAAASAVNGVTFSETVERLYNFFSSSTHRWEIFK